MIWLHQATAQYTFLTIFLLPGLGGTKHRDQFPANEENDFRRHIDSHKLFVDKTRIISVFMKHKLQTILVCRPPLFGKSMTASMLKYFLSNAENQSSYIFDGLVIQRDRSMRKFQNAFPVIHLNFNNMKGVKFKDVVGNFLREVGVIYKRYTFLNESGALNQSEKFHFRQVVNGEAPVQDVQAAILELSALLHKHFKKRVVLIIDTYDAPLEFAYKHGFYTKALKFFKSVFETSLKENPHLNKAFIFGITKIDQESLFPDLKSFYVYTVFDATFSKFFGFMEKEVSQLIDLCGYQAKHTEVLEKIKLMYKGYTIGDDTVYNPWSIVNFFESGKAKGYWFKSTLEKESTNLTMIDSILPVVISEYLLNGNTLKIPNFADLIYPEVKTDRYLCWSLFTQLGYLTSADLGSKVGRSEGYKHIRVKIPNNEVRQIFEDTVEFSQKYNVHPYWEFIHSLTHNKTDVVETCLHKYLTYAGGFIPKEYNAVKYCSYLHYILIGLEPLYGELKVDRFGDECFIHSKVVRKTEPAFMFVLTKAKDVQMFQPDEKTQRRIELDVLFLSEQDVGSFAISRRRVLLLFAVHGSIVKRVPLG